MATGLFNRFWWKEGKVHGNNDGSSLRADGFAKLREQYGCGTVQFTGSDNALYERHLIFDNVVKPAAVGPRERFEAFARSVRDILSQRWVLTEDTYEREDPKRVYYLSLEFLIGRSLANNVTNLLLDPLAKQTAKQKNLDSLDLLEQEPDAGLAMGGSGGWRLASSTRWPRCSSPPWVMGSVTNTASSARPSTTDGSANSRTTGYAARIPGKSLDRTTKWRSS